MTEKKPLIQPHNALLLLADGTVFYGWGVGEIGEASGEICFNTGLTGYQEVLTDPSYAGQIVTFTFPHIGNVGANNEDIESISPAVRGLVIRENITEPSNFRSESHVQAWLEEKSITGICGIDTRRLTRHIRTNGAQNAIIAHVAAGAELPEIADLAATLKETPSLAGLDLAEGVSCTSAYDWTETRWSLEQGHGESTGEGYHIVAIDYGEKLNILRSLASRNCKVTVVPARATADDILALNPDGIFLSNGPGDPAATAKYASSTIKALVDADIPVFGICLGHQLMATMFGATTEKMHQGHRGANHPVRDEQTGVVEITSQNHGFVVSHAGLPDCLEVTHISLFDGTIEGVRHKTKPAFSVQYHPESSPGPHDSQYLFDRFMGMIEDHKKGASAAVTAKAMGA